MNKQLYWTKNGQTQKFKINKEKRYVYNGSSQYHYKSMFYYYYTYLISKENEAQNFSIFLQLIVERVRI